MEMEEARKEAEKILEKDRADFALRSCWNCNAVHEGLKEAGYIISCFECGHWFFKGQQLSEDEKKG
jgi:hypothetical protein